MDHLPGRVFRRRRPRRRQQRRHPAIASPRSFVESWTETGQPRTVSLVSRAIRRTARQRRRAIARVMGNVSTGTLRGMGGYSSRAIALQVAIHRSRVAASRRQQMRHIATLKQPRVSATRNRPVSVMVIANGSGFPNFRTGFIRRASQGATPRVAPVRSSRFAAAPGHPSHRMIRTNVLWFIRRVWILAILTPALRATGTARRRRPPVPVISRACGDGVWSIPGGN